MIRRLLKWFLRKDLLNLLEENVRLKEELVGANENIINLLKNVKYLNEEQAKVKSMYARIFGGIDISLDVNAKGFDRFRSDSWAVLSLQGERETFIKFIELKDRDIQEIGHFLRQFQRGKIDSDYRTKEYLSRQAGFTQVIYDNDKRKRNLFL